MKSWDTWATSTMRESLEISPLKRSIHSMNFSIEPFFLKISFSNFLRLLMKQYELKKGSTRQIQDSDFKPSEIFYTQTLKILKLKEKFFNNINLFLVIQGFPECNIKTVRMNFRCLLDQFLQELLHFYQQRQTKFRFLNRI